MLVKKRDGAPCTVFDSWEDVLYGTGPCGVKSDYEDTRTGDRYCLDHYLEIWDSEKLALADKVW